MRAFSEWMREQTTAKREQPVADEELPDGLWRDSKDRLSARCRVCSRTYEYQGDLDDGFDPDTSYCGGSPSCCP